MFERRKRAGEAPGAESTTRAPLILSKLPFKRWFYRLPGIEPSPLRRAPTTPFVFVHINKTAGTSVGRAIGLPVKQHLTAREIIERISRDAWDSAWKFAFVRNPWDRAVSLYEYRRMKNKTGIESNAISFGDWVQRVFGDDPDPSYHNKTRPFLSQSDWLKDDEGAITLEFIGRFEHLADDFDQVAERIAPGVRLPRLNASRRRSHTDYYDARSRDTVARWFAEDIERFGYVFDT